MVFALVGKGKSVSLGRRGIGTVRLGRDNGGSLAALLADHLTHAVQVQRTERNRKAGPEQAKGGAGSDAVNDLDIELSKPRRA